MDVDGTQPLWMRSKEARSLLRVSGPTLNKWARAGTIPTLVLPGTGGQRIHRLFNITGFRSPGDQPEPDHHPPNDSGGPQDVIYARVSTRKQRPDLHNQVAALRAAHPHVGRVVTDVCSGINFHRHGLSTLLDLAFQGHLRTVVG